MHIPAEQQLSLGRRNGELGDSFVIGSRVRTRHSKFTVVISGLNQQRFRHFLPNGVDHARLRKLIDFLLRDPAAWDLELGLQHEEVPPFNLGRTSGANLGWTTFIDNKIVQRTSTVRIRVRS